MPYHKNIKFMNRDRAWWLRIRIDKCSKHTQQSVRSSPESTSSMISNPINLILCSCSVFSSLSLFYSILLIWVAVDKALSAGMATPGLYNSAVEKSQKSRKNRKSRESAHLLRVYCGQRSNSHWKKKSSVLRHSSSGHIDMMQWIVILYEKLQQNQINYVHLSINRIQNSK